MVLAFSEDLSERTQESVYAWEVKCSYNPPPLRWAVRFPVDSEVYMGFFYLPYVVLGTSTEKKGKVH